MGKYVKKGNKVRVDGRRKGAKEANIMFAIIEFFFDLAVNIMKGIFKILWATAKLLFHILTLFKFRKTND